MRATRRYVRLQAAILLPLGAAVAGLNLAVDPYAASPATGLDRLEDARRNADRATKAERLARGGFDTILFGTSIANQACDPAHPAFGGGRVFVAGLPGSNLAEMRHAFDFALDHGRPRAVLLFADPGMASARRVYVGDFKDSRFNPDLRWPEYRLRQLLGWDPTFDSLGVLRPAAPGEARQRADGFRPRPAEVRLAWEDFAVTIGKYFKEEWNGYRYDEERVAGLAAMVARCRREGIRAVIVIPPFHAAAMEGMRLMGVDRGLERLRRDVATMDAEAWDFTGWDGPVAEPVPLEERGTMRWFSDPVHSTAALGSVFTARALGREDLVPPEFREFGVRLRPGETPRPAGDGAAWRAAHPEEARRVALLFESTAAERARRLRLAAYEGR